MEIEQSVLSTPEAAKFLGVGIRLFAKFANDIPTIQYVAGQKKRLYDIEDLVRFKESRKGVVSCVHIDYPKEAEALIGGTVSPSTECDLEAARKQVKKQKQTNLH